MYNPSLEGWVKIGYADNVEKRVQQLNSHETTPYAFRIYATYEAHERLQDKSLHKLIDQLDSTFVNHGLILYKIMANLCCTSQEKVDTKPNIYL